MLAIGRFYLLYYMPMQVEIVKSYPGVLRCHYSKYTKGNHITHNITHKCSLIMARLRASKRKIFSYKKEVKP